MWRLLTWAPAFAVGSIAMQGFDFHGAEDLVSDVSFLQTHANLLSPFGRSSSALKDLEDDVGMLPDLSLAATDSEVLPDRSATPPSPAGEIAMPKDGPRSDGSQPLSAIEKVVSLAKESISHASHLEAALTETKRQLSVAGTQLKEAAYMEEQLDKAVKVASSRTQRAASMAEAASERQKEAEAFAKAESDKAVSLQHLASVEAQKIALTQRRMEDTERKALERATTAEERVRVLEQREKTQEAMAQSAQSALKAEQRREKQLQVQAASAVRESRVEVQQLKEQLHEAQAEALKAHAGQAAAEEQAARAALTEASQERRELAEELEAAHAAHPGKKAPAASEEDADNEVVPSQEDPFDSEEK